MDTSAIRNILLQYSLMIPLSTTVTMVLHQNLQYEKLPKITMLESFTKIKYITHFHNIGITCLEFQLNWQNMEDTGKNIDTNQNL